MKIFNSILSKIILAILFTVTISIAIISFITSQKIEQSFDRFLEQQTTEVYGQGYGRIQNSDDKELKHQQLVTEFQNSINQSILIASIAGISGSIVLGLILSRQISNPIKLLNKQLTKTRNNSYESLDIVTDTTELNDLVVSFNELISELKRIETLREDLVSDVTHELKTPLTKVIGQIEGCIDGVYKCDNEKLEQILANARQLEALTSRLQELVEIRAGKVKLSLQEFQVKDLVDSIFAGHTPQDVLLINEVDTQATINADPTRLREILENLISNALRHTKKGSVTLSYSNKTIVVKDTGEGIPAEDLPYIFERFYRSDKSRNKETGGLGLGLSIVKELVNLHDWNIEVTSEVNKGTTFNISLN